jgi:hypothetical protein
MSPPQPEHLLPFLLLLLAGCILFHLSERAKAATRRDITVDVPRYGPGFTLRPTNAPPSPNPGASITQVEILFAAIRATQQAGGKVTMTHPALARLRVRCDPAQLAAMGIGPDL